MKKIAGENLMRRVKYICGTSVDIVNIRNEESLILLDACLHYEIQHGNRSTMILYLKARIKYLEAAKDIYFARLRTEQKNRKEKQK